LLTKRHNSIVSKDVLGLIGGVFDNGFHSQFIASDVEEIAKPA
jgi:hypothetical protein